MQIIIFQTSSETSPVSVFLSNSPQLKDWFFQISWGYFHLATSAFPIGKDLRKVRVFFQNWKKQLFLTNLGYV